MKKSIALLALAGLVLPASAATYSNNFDGYADGTTDLGDGTAFNGASASIQGGRLQLTIDNQGLGFASFTIPALANIKPLAKVLGLPYFPLAAPVVLPAKIHICVGEPMFFDDDDIPEEQVTARVELVKAAVGEMVKRGLNQRKRIF